jgi:hypothetical protein
MTASLLVGMSLFASSASSLAPEVLKAKTPSYDFSWGCTWRLRFCFAIGMTLQAY